MPEWKRTLYIAFAVQFLSAFGFSSSLSFISLYISDLDSTLGLTQNWAVALAVSVQALAMMIAAPLWGMVSDRTGRKLMVIRAGIGSAITLGLMGIVISAEQLIILRGLQGLVTGVTPALVALVAASAPRERSGYAMGLLQVGMWSGMAIGPMIGGVMADTWGYEANFWFTAILLAAGTLLMYVGVGTKDEVDIDLDRRGTSVIQQWRGIIGLPGVSLTYTAKALNWMVYTMLNPFIPLVVASMIIHDERVATATGVITGLAALSSTLSAYFLGRLSDRVGQREMLIVSMLSAALFFFPQALVTQFWQLAVLQVLTGIAIGGMLPSISALLTQYTPVGIEGAVYGLDTSVTSASRTIAPLLGAAVVSTFGLTSIFWLVGGIFGVFALVLMRQMPIPQPQPKINFQRAGAMD